MFRLTLGAGGGDILHGPHQGEPLPQSGDTPVARHLPPRWQGHQQGTVPYSSVQYLPYSR